MSELNEMLPKNKPFQFEGLDIRPSFRANDAGAHTYSVNIMVTEEQWNALKTIPRHRMLGGILYWYDDEEELPPAVAEELSPIEPEKSKKEKPTKEPSGPYSEYWRIMVIKGVKNHPDMPEVLDCTTDQVWDCLHTAFETESMSRVSPRVFEAWVKEKGMSEGLITMSHNAEVQAFKK